MQFSRQNRPWRIERDAAGDIVIDQGLGGTDSIHQGHVFGQLYTWHRASGLGEVLGANVGFNLSDGSCLAPDAAWLATERCNFLKPEQQDSFLSGAPDFVIELRSLSESRVALQARMQTWLDNGAQLAWLIDPIEGNVTIYRPGHAPEKLERPEVVAAADPIAGFELRCTRFWS
jgi:Uma2 family endonuclease